MVPSFRRATVKGQKGISVVSKTECQSSFTLFTYLYSLNVPSHIQWQYIQNALWTSDGLLVNVSFKRSKEQLSTSLQFSKRERDIHRFLCTYFQFTQFTHYVTFLWLSTIFQLKTVNVLRWMEENECQYASVKMIVFMEKRWRRKWSDYPAPYHPSELHSFYINCCVHRETHTNPKKSKQ